MNKTTLIRPVLLIAGASLLMTGCVVREEVRYRNPPPAVIAEPGEVVVTEPPPAPQVDVEVVQPGPGFFWIPGAYFWVGGRWEWRGGHWDRPPRPGVRWYGPHYVYRGGRHIWVRGGWR